MKIDRLHGWELSPRKAVALQRRLAPRVRLGRPRRRKWELIAGADAAIDRENRRLVAGVVVLRLPDMAWVAQSVAVVPLKFPYVPGLLSFREAPGLIRAFEGLSVTPHAIICDGQGLAHPRAFGLACHLGLWLGAPTIGSAKSRLVGRVQGKLGARRGSRRPLIHQGRPVGYVLRTREGVKPLYVSPGHRIDADTAADLVLDCCTRYRLPEPQRQADLLVERCKREESGGSL